MPTLHLRPSVPADLEHFFRFQLDPEGAQLAAFMPKNYTDEAAFLAKYNKLLTEPTVNMQTILLDDRIIGSVSKFEMEGEAEITYWLDRSYWGKGFASAALQSFLEIESARPITGRAVADNAGSRRVLEKAGFRQTGTDRGFASARGEEIEEVIYQLI